MLPAQENTTKTVAKSSKPENICHICKKTFSKAKSLERHKAIHERHKTNETTFQCTVCGLYEY